MKTIKLLIAGDSLYDHHTYMGNSLTPDNSKLAGTTIQSMSGGCFLLADVLHHISQDKSLAIETQTSVPDDYHGYAVWKNYNKIWRVSEKMGYGPKPTQFSVPDIESDVWDNQACDIAVFDDAAMNYRFDKTKWPAFIVDKKKIPKLTIVKMSYPVVKGDLWTYLRDGGFTKNLILIVSADDLRRGEIKISKGISWERTIQDVLTELNSNSALKDLKLCPHVIINFGSEGALWIQQSVKSSKDSIKTLIFDPGCLEGEWAKEIPGDILGGSSCFNAGVIRSAVNAIKAKKKINVDTINFSKGIAEGLAAMRMLCETGHGPAGKFPEFPFKEIAETINGKALEGFRSVGVSESAFKSPGLWSLIDASLSEKSGPLYGRARQVAIYGLGALKDIPYGSFGKLDTLDRAEIESLNGIKNLINGYVAKSEQPKPLSIGVFGPPGSGKSFGIKQIVKGILGKKVPILEFNLSQFDDQKMIYDALHQVRDKVLGGVTPVVFWDEFDSKELYWLQYLLAPMQDGSFLEGQISHPIGKCIFVFAGGTSYTMENFAPEDLTVSGLKFSKERIKKNQDDIKAFKLKKGPDFVSRLHGYLNVLGPNRRQQYNKKTEKWEDDLSDNCFPLRRAVLLRVMAGIFDKNQVFDMDFGLLNAFIKIDKYHHGARSMETIINLAKQENSAGFLRSSLPPRTQAQIHVDYDKFLSLVEQDKSFKNKIDDFAKDIHDFYKDIAIKEKWGVPWAIPYEQLPPPLKEDNIAAARRIPDIFSLISLQVVPPSKDQKNITLKAVEKLVDDNIEVLAVAEHDMWMKEKLINGWRPVEKEADRDDDKKLHHCLVPYEKLSEEEKTKDRNAVKNYITIIHAAGFVFTAE